MNAIKMVMVRTQPWIGEMVIIGIFGALMFRAGIDKAISESLKASIPYWVGLLMCAVWIDKVYKKGAETEVFIKVGLKKDANTLYARCC